MIPLLVSEIEGKYPEREGGGEEEGQGWGSSSELMSKNVKSSHLNSISRFGQTIADTPPENRPVI